MPASLGWWMMLRFNVFAWTIKVSGVAAICLLAGTISAADYVKPPADQNITPCGSNPDMDLAAYADAYASIPRIPPRGAAGACPALLYPTSPRPHWCRRT